VAEKDRREDVNYLQGQKKKKEKKRGNAANRKETSHRGSSEEYGKSAYECGGKGGGGRDAELINLGKPSLSLPYHVARKGNPREG